MNTHDQQCCKLTSCCSILSLLLLLWTGWLFIICCVSMEVTLLKPALLSNHSKKLWWLRPSKSPHYSDRNKSLLLFPFFRPSQGCLLNLISMLHLISPISAAHLCRSLTFFLRRSFFEDTEAFFPSLRSPVFENVYSVFSDEFKTKQCKIETCQAPCIVHSGPLSHCPGHTV